MTAQIHLTLQMLACLSHKIVCTDQFNNHHNSTSAHSTSLRLAFLANIQQRRTLERDFIALNITNTQCPAYQKYTGTLQNTFSNSRYGVCIRGLAPGYHCSLCTIVSNKLDSGKAQEDKLSQSGL